MERRVGSGGEERMVDGEVCRISLVAFRHDLKGSMWRLVLLLLVMHKGRDCLK